MRRLGAGRHIRLPHVGFYRADLATGAASSLFNPKAPAVPASGTEPMSELRAMDVLRPYLWVAMAAFVIGFAGYMAVRQAQAPNYAETPAPAVMASASLRAA
jgi:hypothetical protein